MQGLVKIGSSRKHPMHRAGELGSPTAVPGDFVVEYFKAFDDAFEAESIVHEALADHRYNKAREFFSVSVGDAIALIASLDLPSNGETGGAQRVEAVMPPMPWAELFAQFPDDGSPRELTMEEQAACLALERRTRS